MKKTKALLLLWAAVAAVSLSIAPAAAQAEGPFYYVDFGEFEFPIGEEAEAATGEAQPPKAPEGYSLTLSTGVKLGPCPFAGQFQAWNDKKGGHSRFTKWTFTPPCDTSIAANCHVVVATAAGLPWNGVLVYLAGGVPADEIGSKTNPITFTYTLGANCGGLTNTPITATATGPVQAISSGGGCFKYTKAGTFNTTIKGVTGTVDAEECRHVAGGQPMNAK